MENKIQDIKTQSRLVDAVQYRYKVNRGKVLIYPGLKQMTKVIEVPIETTEINALIKGIRQDLADDLNEGEEIYVETREMGIGRGRSNIRLFHPEEIFTEEQSEEKVG